MSPSTSPVLSAGTVVFCGGVLSVKLPPARLVIGVETPARFRSGRVWPATEGYAGGASMGIALSLCIAKNLLGIRTMRGSITGNLLQGTRKTMWSEAALHSARLLHRYYNRPLAGCQEEILRCAQNDRSQTCHSER